MCAAASTAAMNEPRSLEASQCGSPSQDGTEADLGGEENLTPTGSGSFAFTTQPGGGSSTTTPAATAARTVVDEDKFCCVCGDRALGYNFDAITCESCKAFFRRNAAKHDAIKCMFSGDCSITINTRRFCSACRLRKCFLVGMKKDMILGEQEKRYRKEKVLLNKEKRLRKQQMLQLPPPQHPSQAAAAAAASGVTSTSSPSLMLIGQPSFSALCAAAAAASGHVLSSSARGSGGFSGVQPGDTAATPLGTQGRTGGSGSRVLSRDDSSSCSVDSVVGCSGCPVSGKDDRSAPVSPWSRIGVVRPFLQDDLIAFPTPAAAAAGGMRRELNTDELGTLGALDRTYALTIGADCDDDGGSVQWTKCSSLEFFLNHTGSFVRRHVTFAKHLQEFAGMPQEVQVSLLKASVLSCMILRSAHVYDLASDCWVDSRGVSTSLDVLSSVFADVDPGTRDVHSNLVRSIKQLVRAVSVGPSSSLTFALLQCIALLSPEHVRQCDGGGSAAMAAAAVSDAQLRYVALLRRHLEATLSYAAASELLPNLLQCLTMCKYYAQQHGKAIMSCDATRVEPLLREVFNL